MIAAVAVALVVAASATAVAVSPRSAKPFAPQAPRVAVAPRAGYWLAGSAGEVSAYGSTALDTSATAGGVKGTVVGMAPVVGGGGYWLVTSRGQVLAFGDAHAYGPRGNALGKYRIVGIAASPDGNGYWLASSGGRVLSFGDAAFLGSSEVIDPRARVVGMAADPDGAGYWLVTDDGDVFGFGDARFLGSAASTDLGSPVVGMAATPDGRGYWLATANGQVVGFGDAGDFGSVAPADLKGTIAGLAATSDGRGYWVVARDGDVYAFGDALFLGSEVGQVPAGQSVSAIATSVLGPSGKVAVPSSTTTTTTTTPGTTRGVADSYGAATAICGQSILDSPYSYAGRVGHYTSGEPGLPTFGPGGRFPLDKVGFVISPSTVNNTPYNSPRTLYYFEPGTYDLVNGFAAGEGGTYIGGYTPGAGGATLNGIKTNGTAFLGNYMGATTNNVNIEYLTVENFNPNNDQSAIDNSGSASWTIKFDTVEDVGYVKGSDDGSGAAMGAGDVYEYNCFTKDGQYAVNAAAIGGSTGSFVNAVMDYNEISYDGYSEYPDIHGCGCSGGIKFWQSVNAQFVGNWVHDNYNVGVWFDTNNTGALVEDNFITGNYAQGLTYEVSYNADIADNTLVENALGTGPLSGNGSITPALYISSSSGAYISGSNYNNELLVTGNWLIDNWDGLELYHNTGRYCDDAAIGIGPDTGCTLTGGSVFNQTNTSACDQQYGTAFNGLASGLAAATVLVPGLSPASTWWSACVYNTRNVTVFGNLFVGNEETLNTLVGADDCGTSGYICDFNGIYAYQAMPTPSFRSSGCGGGANAPFTCEDLSSSQIQFSFNNEFRDNSYYGPWKFWAFAQNNGANPILWKTWQGRVRSCGGTESYCTGPFGQDAGSYYRSSGGLWWDYSEQSVHWPTTTTS
jgi:hypothetical protein